MAPINLVIKKKVGGKPQPRHRINQFISAKTVRVIDPTTGENKILVLSEALEWADEKDVDLVQITEGDVPVCKLIEYGKFLFQLQKAQKKTVQHAPKLKQMSVSPSISNYDLEHKLNQARGWIKDGSKVQFSLRFKGRENAHKEFGFEVFAKVTSQMENVAKLDGEIKFNGNAITMILCKK